jgi:protein SCO1/2
MNRWRNLIGRCALGPQSLCSLVFAMALITSAPAAGAAMSSVTVGGPFTLVAPDGTTVTDQTYRGKWLLVYFGYTLCPDTCPTTLLEIATALEKLGPDAVELQPLFITIDPQRDTPDVMGKYTRSFDARIVGLTGSPQQIATVAHEYGAYYARHDTGAGAEDYAMDHSTYIYLMDVRGEFVRGFDADTPGDRIAEVVHQLMAQSRAEERHGESSSRATR